MRKFKNEKGFTLVEILVVIVIIGILFAVVLPRIDFASDKARITGVKTDLRQYIVSAEMYLRTTAGNDINVSEYNEYLDNATHFTPSGDNTSGVSNLEDPWGVPYEVHLVDRSDNYHGDYSIISVYSYGKGDSELRDKLESAAPGIPNYPDFTMAVYFINGTIVTCTEGFGDNDIQLSSNYSFDSTVPVEYCGGPIVEN